MNKGHQDAASLAVHLIDSPAPIEVEDASLSPISASASVKDGTVLISVTNLSLDSSTKIDFDLRGVAVRSPRGRLLSADQPQDHNTPDAPAVVAPADFEVILSDGRLVADLPPHSFATVELELV